MEIIKLKISSDDGYLDIDDLPLNCSFNKKKTGSGGTRIALKNDENYVILVPTTELILNKCYPPTDEEGNELEWKKEVLKPGLSPVRNLFGLFGPTAAILKDFNNYLKKGGVKKIIATYDKISWLVKHCDPKQFRLLIDEEQELLKIYSYRKEAVEGVFAHYKDFKSFVFMSATPIDMDFRPSFMKEIPMVVAEWNTTDRLSIIPQQTNQPYLFVANIIKDFRLNGFIEVNGVKSEQLFIYLNNLSIT
ncbi:DEAD/DEAH box helicase family protein [Parabacteroides sp. OttesenSCG-928-K15]|nr:DEAD/DEAH box helicase family protein [Parabacteroides sp. OttesenSCG-928-K15]